MNSSALYPALLLLHLSSVAASIGLFAVRGIGVQLGRAWPMQATWRRASVGIDVTLLAAGASLWVVMQHNPLAEPWLAAKLALLLGYIVAGSFALKRAKTLGAKRGFLLLALAMAAAMISIATTRNPLGHAASFL